MTLVIPNSNGVATFLWNYIPLTRQMSVTCGFGDLLISDNPATLAAALRSSITVGGAPANVTSMSTQWQFLGVKVLMRSSGGLLLAGSSLVTTTGTTTAPTNAQPVFSPLVVSKLTAQAGKKFRGRMYPPFTVIDENSVDAGGAINPTVVTNTQTQWTALLSNMLVNSVPAVLLHDSSTPGPTNATTITNFLVRPVAGIQRRRRTRGA